MTEATTMDWTTAMIFLAGAWVGASVGALVIGLCVAASDRRSAESPERRHEAMPGLQRADNVIPMPPCKSPRRT